MRTPKSPASSADMPSPASSAVSVDRERLLQLRRQLDALLASLR
jgi:hypothetical protein